MHVNFARFLAHSNSFKDYANNQTETKNNNDVYTHSRQIIYAIRSFTDLSQLNTFWHTQTHTPRCEWESERTNASESNEVEEKWFP